MLPQVFIILNFGADVTGLYHARSWKFAKGEAIAALRRAPLTGCATVAATSALTVRAGTYTANVPEGTTQTIDGAFVTALGSHRPRTSGRKRWKPALRCMKDENPCRMSRPERIESRIRRTMSMVSGGVCMTGCVDRVRGGWDRRRVARDPRYQTPAGKAIRIGGPGVAKLCQCPGAALGDTRNTGDNAMETAFDNRETVRLTGFLGARHRLNWTVSVLDAKRMPLPPRSATCTAPATSRTCVVSHGRIYDIESRMDDIDSPCSRADCVG